MPPKTPREFTDIFFGEDIPSIRKKLKNTTFQDQLRTKVLNSVSSLVGLLSQPDDAILKSLELPLRLLKRLRELQPSSEALHAEPLLIQEIVKANVIPILVNLLDDEITWTDFFHIKIAATKLLHALSCASQINKSAIAEAGAIPKLAALLAQPFLEEAELCNLRPWSLGFHIFRGTACFLESLAYHHPQNQTEIGKTQAITALIRFLPHRSFSNLALDALIAIAHNHPANQQQIVLAGAIPKLADLLSGRALSTVGGDSLDKRFRFAKELLSLDYSNLPADSRADLLTTVNRDGIRTILKSMKHLYYIGEPLSYSFALNLLKWEEIVDTTSDAAEVAMGGAGGPSPAAPPAALKDSEIKMAQDMIAFKCSELEDPTTLIDVLDPKDSFFNDPHLQTLVLKNPLLIDKLISFLAHENPIIRLNTARIFTLLSTADPKIVACLTEYSGATTALINLLNDRDDRIQTLSFDALCKMYCSCYSDGERPSYSNRCRMTKGLECHMRKMTDADLFDTLCTFKYLSDINTLDFQNRVLRFIEKLDPLHKMRLIFTQEVQRADSSIGALFIGNVFKMVYAVRGEFVHNNALALALIKETEEYQRHSVVRPFSGERQEHPLPYRLGGPLLL